MRVPSLNSYARGGHRLLTLAGSSCRAPRTATAVGRSTGAYADGTSQPMRTSEQLVNGRGGRSATSLDNCSSDADADAAADAHVAEKSTQRRGMKVSQRRGGRAGGWRAGKMRRNSSTKRPVSARWAARSRRSSTNSASPLRLADFFVFKAMLLTSGPEMSSLAPP